MKMKKHFFNSATFVALTATAFCFSQDANAAGFALTEQSITGLGRAFAGSGIVGDDYSAIAYNPAGMTLLDSGMQVGAAEIWQHGEVKGSLGVVEATAASGQEDVNIFSTIPHFFGQYKINDSVNVGLGIYVPFGLASDYPSDWFGKDQGLLSSLQSIDFAPSIAYRMNDNWSFGASFIARYGYLELTQTGNSGTPYATYSEMEMDGWAYYGRFGVMYEHSEDTRFGISYQSKSTTGSQTLKGDHEITGYSNLSGTSSVTTILPEQWLLSAFTKHGKFGYSASAKYSRWEGFDTFAVYSDYTGTNKPVSAAHYDWQNTWTVSAGLDYYHDDVWTFRGGLGYDESPYRSSANRTVKIPENDRVWMSLGFSYQIDDKKKFDFGYTHLYLPTYKAQNGDGQYANVKYDVNADVFGIAFQYDL